MSERLPGTEDRDGSLVRALEELLESDSAHALVLLRETPLDASCINRGDIDLLGTHDAVADLIRRATGFARAGTCHVRVRRESADKVQLELLSLDLRHRIVFDLWLEVWQLDGGARCLRFDDVSSQLKERSGDLLRMPPDLEASVYVHHLATKHKDLRSSEVQARLDHYARACAVDCPELAAELSSLRDEGVLRTGLLDETRRRIRRATVEQPWRRPGARWQRRLARWTQSSWLVPRGAPMVAIVGCDGTGKTSLTESISSSAADRFSTRVGKEFYRRWLPFRLLYRFSELTVGVSQERIDEWIAPLAFGLAWLSLWTFQLRRKLRHDTSLVLMDRALVDFLYVKRKSDQPHFSPAARLLAPLGTGIAAVHLIVPHDILYSRKAEMTPAGHASYDSDMFDRYTSASSFDYLALTNGSALEVAARRLGTYLLREYQNESDPR